MTALDVIDFELPPELEATTPAELRAGSTGRDDVRLLVSSWRIPR